MKKMLSALALGATLMIAGHAHAQYYYLPGGQMVVNGRVYAPPAPPPTYGLPQMSNGTNTARQNVWQPQSRYLPATPGRPSGPPVGWTSRGFSSQRGWHR